jgi:glucokinase
MWLLAADIGGTNARLRAQNTQLPEKEYTEVYASADYEDIIPLIIAFKNKYDIARVQAACFAVAGPVQQGRAKITNLPWQLEQQKIEQDAGIDHLHLVNDFIGVAHGVPVLAGKDYITLQSAEPDPHGTIAIIGAGTGLGHAILAWHDGRRISIASEGGHVDFAPRDDEEISLFNYWRRKLTRVTYESFVSGPGLLRLFEFYTDYLQQPPNAEMQQKLDCEDPAAVVVKYARHHPGSAAHAALQRFVKLYAAQAANFALTCKATGGVYLAGGISPRIIDELKSKEFSQSFNDKYPMQSLTASIPVRVIMNTDVGLRGAMELARLQAEKN